VVGAEVREGVAVLVIGRPLERRYPGQRLLELDPKLLSQRRPASGPRQQPGHADRALSVIGERANQRGGSRQVVARDGLGEYPDRARQAVWIAHHPRAGRRGAHEIGRVAVEALLAHHAPVPAVVVDEHQMFGTITRRPRSFSPVGTADRPVRTGPPLIDQRRRQFGGSQDLGQDRLPSADVARVEPTMGDPGQRGIPVVTRV